MYRHIMAATDGSELADKAVGCGIKLAASLNARLTIAHIGIPYSPPVYAGDIVPASLVSPEEHEQRVREAADKILTHGRERAEAAGVTTSVVFDYGDAPHETLIALAEKNGCDLIVMASHARRGLGALLLGSETQKVLSHTKIDVLVIR